MLMCGLLYLFPYVCFRMSGYLNGNRGLRRNSSLNRNIVLTVPAHLVIHCVLQGGGSYG